MGSHSSHSLVKTATLWRGPGQATAQLEPATHQMKAVMGRKWRSRKVLRCNEITTTTINSDNNHKTQNTIKRFGIKKWKPWTLVSFCSFSLVLCWSLRTLASSSPQKKIVSPGGSNYICYILAEEKPQMSADLLKVQSVLKNIEKVYWKKFIQTSFYFISTTRGEGNGVLSPVVLPV